MAALKPAPPPPTLQRMPVTAATSHLPEAHHDAAVGVAALLVGLQACAVNTVGGCCAQLTHGQVVSSPLAWPGE